MRVTYNMLSSSVCRNISASSESLLKAQNISSTGKRIQKPSDDVSGTGHALRLQSSISDIDQFKSNCTVATGSLSAASSALTSIVSSLQNVRTLTAQAANSTLSDSARSGIAQQLDQISAALAQIGNTKDSETYIFSGTKTTVPAIAADTSGTAPYAYNGNSTSIDMQIGPGATIATNVTANQIFNIGGCAVSGTDDVFSMIAKIRDQVTSGDTAGLSSSLSAIDANLNNVSNLQTRVGSAVNRVTSMSTSLSTMKTSLSDLLSKTTDADYTQAVIDLKTQENIYEAATSTASSVLQLSLVNFFK